MHKGVFRYNRLVFGVSSVTTLWQRALDQVLQGVTSTQCYLDDIIVTGHDDKTIWRTWMLFLKDLLTGMGHVR